MSQAVRVSITDPFYINPARIGKSYYWGGAVDLFPIETASELADEVLVNYPAGLYNAYEDLAISSVFGFAQSDRTQEAAKQNHVKWIDTSGTNKLAMDPTVIGFLFNTNIPKKYDDFMSLIDRQYKFGYQRGVEAVKLQKNKNNVHSHLRETAVGAK
jgi:predicted acylesterase/phospholipase RssA